MKRILILLSLILIVNCAQSTIADGEKTILGSEAYKRILEAANKIDSYYYTSVKQPQQITYNNMINAYIQPALIQISDNKIYDKASVDDCISKIISLTGFIVGGQTAQIQCKIKDAGIINIGGVKIGDKEAKKNKLLMTLL